MSSKKFERMNSRHLYLHVLSYQLIFCLGFPIVLRSQSVTHFPIAPNFFVNIPGEYPVNYQPEWKNVQNRQFSYYCGEEISVHREAIQEPNMTADVDIFLGIGSHNGKAVVYFSLGGPLFLTGDIMTAGNSITVGGSYQTFRIDNFVFPKDLMERAVSLFSKDDVTRAVNYFSTEKFSGTLTIRSTPNADLFFKFIINNYNNAGQLLYTYTSKVCHSSNLLPPQTAIIYQQNQRYLSLFDNVLSTSVKNAEFISAGYSKGSVRNAIVTSSFNGSTRVIRAKANFTLSATTGLDTAGQWIDFLMLNEKVVGFTLWRQPLLCILPPMDRAPTYDELNSNLRSQILTLQNKYLFDKITYMQNLYTSGTVDTHQCLCTADFTLTQDDYIDEPYIYDPNTQEWITHKKYIGQKVGAIVPGLKNNCNFAIIIRAVAKSQFSNFIEYTEKSIQIDPAGLIEAMPVRRYFDYTAEQPRDQNGRIIYYGTTVNNTKK